MKCVVTGATGFLGGTLTERLLSDGHEVVATGRDEGRGGKLRNLGANWVTADLADAPALRDLCRGATHVYHCGALCSPWGRYADFHAANVVGTRNVLSACREAQVERLVYVSSPSVYSPAAGPPMINEDCPQTGPPLNHYVRTKRLAEEEVRRASDEGLPVISIRPRAIFGPGDRTLFPRIIRANWGGRFPMIGSGDPLMDCSYVTNVVDALLLAAEAPAHCIGRWYNITNGEPLARSELFEMLFTAIGKPFQPRQIPLPAARGLARLLETISVMCTASRWEPVLTRYSVSVLSDGRVLDISAARRDLGYEPLISVHDGLEQFAHWWKEHAHANAN